MTSLQCSTISKGELEGGMERMICSSRSVFQDSRSLTVRSQRGWTERFGVNWSQWWWSLENQSAITEDFSQLRVSSHYLRRDTGYRYITSPCPPNDFRHFQWRRIWLRRTSTVGIGLPRAQASCLIRIITDMHSLAQVDKRKISWNLHSIFQFR